MGSSTQRAGDGTHLDEDTEDERIGGVKEGVEEETRGFGLMFRHVKRDVDKEIEMEIEDAHGGSEARDLAQKMEIDRLEVEALKNQFDKETVKTQIFGRAQELIFKVRSWSALSVHEATKNIQANREKREAKRGLEKLEAAHKAAVDELDRKANEATEKGGAEPAPIQFKDAVGRKFSFPFHLCNTWPVCSQKRLGSIKRFALVSS